ncbi:endonuclease/exonuclease/phosphatase family protein [Pseudoroseomonas globiformis]|uniref:Endonuclease/exonuclease/phosphatase family protein n=1 Tax=Teichococcus globiformis TaxID=2307229 RepID=A0ABV7FXD9_9PROT
MIIRVMTWNIHAGIGMDGRRDLDRILGFIRRHRPDILAVQEVDGRALGAAPSPFTLLQSQIGGGTAVAETIIGADGAYGHMLLSRWPFEDYALHDLSMKGREPRTAIFARVRTPHGGLNVIAAHLGLKHHERRMQAAKLKNLARNTEGPVTLLGDLNEWTWRGPVWKALSQVFPARTAHRTFPSRCPVLRLDEIFCRPASLLGSSWRDTSAWQASDHLPVIAELNMHAAPTACTGRELVDADFTP